MSAGGGRYFTFLHGMVVVRYRRRTELCNQHPLHRILMGSGMTTYNSETKILGKYEDMRETICQHTHLSRGLQPTDQKSLTLDEKSTAHRLETLFSSEGGSECLHLSTATCQAIDGVRVDLRCKQILPA